MILVHGTTRHRAERIGQFGPDPRYREPSGQPCDDGFSMYLASGPYSFGTPESYARGKAFAFPGEGGPAILEVDVPGDVVANAFAWFLPGSQGLVQFDIGDGIEELLAAWPDLAKRVIAV